MQSESMNCWNGYRIFSSFWQTTEYIDKVALREVVVAASLSGWLIIVFS